MHLFIGSYRMKFGRYLYETIPKRLRIYSLKYRELKKFIEKENVTPTILSKALDTSENPFVKVRELLCSELVRIDRFVMLEASVIERMILNFQVSSGANEVLGLISDLDCFIQLNFIAFCKLAKKIDKSRGQRTSEWFVDKVKSSRFSSLDCSIYFEETVTRVGSRIESEQRYVQHGQYYEFPNETILSFKCGLIRNGLKLKGSKQHVTEYLFSSRDDSFDYILWFEDGQAMSYDMRTNTQSEISVESFDKAIIDKSFNDTPLRREMTFRKSCFVFLDNFQVSIEEDLASIAIVAVCGQNVSEWCLEFLKGKHMFSSRWEMLEKNESVDTLNVSTHKRNEQEKTKSEQIDAPESDKRNVRDALVRVEPKSFFANERVLLDWLHVTLLLTGIAALSKSSILGLILSAAPMIVIIWAIREYQSRRQALLMLSSDGYAAYTGPFILVLTLLFVLTDNLGMMFAS